MFVTARTLIGQPGPDPAKGTFGFWAPVVFVESLSRQRGLIRDEPVNTKIEQALHIPRGVDRPGINLLTTAMRVEEEPAVESVLLDTEEIDVQPRRLAGVEGKQVANGHLRSELAHLQKRLVFEALDHNLIEHPLLAHRFNDFAGEARLMIAVVFQLNVQLDAPFGL